MNFELLLKGWILLETIWSCKFSSSYNIQLLNVYEIVNHVVLFICLLECNLYYQSFYDLQNEQREEGYGL